MLLAISCNAINTLKYGKKIIRNEETEKYTNSDFIYQEMTENRFFFF